MYHLKIVTYSHGHLGAQTSHRACVQGSQLPYLQLPKLGKEIINDMAQLAKTCQVHNKIHMSISLTGKVNTVLHTDNQQSGAQMEVGSVCPLFGQ